MLIVLMAVVALTAGAGSAGAATKAPIVIGDTCDCSGALASSVGGWAPGLEVWKKWINARGGIDGHQVQIIEQDTKSNPVAQVTAAKQLLGNKKVIALIPGSATGVNISQTITAAKAPVVGGAGSDTLWSTNQYVFPSTTTPNGQARSLAVMAVNGKKGAKVAEFYCAEAAVCQQSLSLFGGGVKAAGGKLVYTASIAATAPDYTAVCLAAKASGATAMWVADASVVFERVATACATNGYKPIWVSSSFTNDMLKVPALNGMRTSFINQPFNGPAAATFRAAVAKYNPKFAKQPFYGQYAFQAWNSGQLLAKAIETAKPKGPAVTRADVFRGLYGLHNETLGGAVPPLTFHKGKPATVNCFYLGQLKNGKLVTQAKAVC